MLGFGRRSEARAAKLLKKRGYKIVAKNYSTVRGEIDIVATSGDVLVFVEVKARSSNAFGSAIGAVNATKRRRLIRAAEAYLLDNPTEQAIRFDLVAFTGREVLVVEDAFQAETD